MRVQIRTTLSQSNDQVGSEMRDTASHDATVGDRYRQFLALLDAEDKEACVLFALERLETGDMDIVDLYEGVLAPAAREQRCSGQVRASCIWEEHVRTSIVRTVLECCYPYLMKARRLRVQDAAKGRAVIVCPSEEYHELGARMAADLFTLSGYDVTFVGANTPQQDIVEAATLLQPTYIGVSVTNPYNVLAARRIIQQLREIRNRTNSGFQIIVGGAAFEHNPSLAHQLGADRMLQTYDDIQRLSKVEQ